MTNVTLDLEKERVVQLEAQGEELIPGIPNEITLNQILTKLPHWSDFHILSSVNRSWLQAIRSHQVYEARMRSNSTESLAVINHGMYSTVIKFALYSVRDGRHYDVPPIPQLGRIPPCSQCVSLDGRLYVLGGVRNCNEKLPSDEVYVLDLAGQRGWRRCASMQQPRKNFGCGILNGKIYACSGHSLIQPEVYDPEVDAWSPLPPMLSSFLFKKPRVDSFGEQLIVQPGNSSHPLLEGYEVYNPVKEKWQFVGPCPEALAKNFLFLMFAKERMYAITWSDIHVQEGQDRWTHLHSLSSESSMEFWDASYIHMPSVPVVVDDELLTVVHWAKSGLLNTSLIRSKGFCSGKKEIVWEDARWSGSKKYDDVFMNTIMCTVRL